MPAQLLPASEVFPSILNGIFFKALQFFRGVQRWLCRLACQPPQQLLESFLHPMLFNQVHYSPVSIGVAGIYRCQVSPNAPSKIEITIKSKYLEKIKFLFRVIYTVKFCQSLAPDDV